MKIKDTLSAIGRGWDWASQNIFYVAAAICIAGFLFIVLSVPMGISFLTLDGNVHPLGEVGRADHVFKDFNGVSKQGLTKEVGYFAALNWSVYGAILLPMIVAFCLNVRANMRRTLEQLAKKRLIRTEQFEAIPLETIMKRWDEAQPGLVALTLVVSLVVLGFVMNDWWQVVGAPLLGISNLVGEPIVHTTMEYDWSVAPLFATDVNVAADFVFGLLAYVLIPGFGSVLAFGTFVGAIHFVFFVSGTIPSGNARWRLCAIPESSNKLCGFSTFEPFFSTLVSAAIAIIFGLLLMMLQNQYLRDLNSGNIFTFFIDQGKVGWDTVAKSQVATLPKNLLDWLLEPGFVLVANPQFGISLPVFAFVFAVCALGTWYGLNVVARDAGKWSREHIAIVTDELNRPAGEVEQELREMDVWPIGWISLNELLMLLLFLLIAIFSYRLTILGGAWLAVKAINTIWDYVSKPRRPRPPATPARRSPQPGTSQS